MNRDRSKNLLNVGALVLLSPAFAALSFLVLALVFLIGPVAGSPLEWSDNDRWVRIASFTLFSTVMSVDVMLHSYYLTVPALAAVAMALVQLDLGIRSVLVRLLVQGSSIGVFYALFYVTGTTFGWLRPAFWT